MAAIGVATHVHVDVTLSGANDGIAAHAPESAVRSLLPSEKKVTTIVDTIPSHPIDYR